MIPNFCSNDIPSDRAVTLGGKESNSHSMIRSVRSKHFSTILGSERHARLSFAARPGRCSGRVADHAYQTAAFNPGDNDEQAVEDMLR